MSFFGCFCFFSSECSKFFFFFAKLIGVILALELVASKGWSHVWLETDLTLVVAAFKNASLVTWNIVNRWKNYVNILFDRNFRASHIYREGNECADWLANHDTILTNFCG